MVERGQGKVMGKRETVWDMGKVSAVKGLRKRGRCGGSESYKSQERTDLLSEGTGFIYRAGKL